MDDDERNDKTQSTVLTIKCLRQGNINKLTQKTNSPKEKEESNEEEDRQFQVEETMYLLKLS